MAGFFSKLISRVSSDLAIDLGTANALVYARNKGIILNEPSVVAVQRTQGNQGTKILALERTPPELATDIVDNGIVLTGGGALLRNLDLLVKERCGLPVMIAEDPLTCVVMGSGRILDELDTFKDMMLEGS